MLWALVFLFSGRANAADSTALAQQRWQANQKISFYCDIGRPIVKGSEEALSVEPSKACTYNGPLDSKLPLKNLQPPFLNPRLTRAQLKTELTSHSIALDAETSASLTFHLSSGESFVARDAVAKTLEDTLLHLGAYPADWGKTFVTISGSGLAAFRELARVMAGSAIFWRNPHVPDETLARAKFKGTREYLPLTLVSKCDLGAIASVTAPILIAGDMHTQAEAQYVVKLLAARPFAWVALEITRDRLPEVEAFLSATKAEDEDALLARILDRLPNDLTPHFATILRFAKSHQLKVILLDYSESYFNFPFTDTAFHGTIIAARNLMWAAQLPAGWSGTGLVFAGLAHFTDTPGADFQNFVRDRFPGLQMMLINPLESCLAPMLVSAL